MNNKPNPGPWATLMFASIMWVFSAMYLGLFKGDNYLMYGVILAVSLPFWVKAANDYYAMEDPYMIISGHYYMAFGFLFGGMMGFGYLACALGHVFPIVLQDETVFGVIFIVGGVFLLPQIPSMLYLDKVSCITYVIADIWLFGGIYYFIPDSVFLYYLNVVCCLVMTVGVTWMMINESAIMVYGKGVPMGKPFKAFPTEE